MKILIVNPGSTSTKVALFENESPVLQEALRHQTQDLAQFASISDQYAFRLNIIEGFLTKSDIKLEDLSGIVGMGGLLRPLIGGTYFVNDAMLKDLQSSAYGQHASNLGGIIAHNLAQKAGCPAYIVDPVVVDEFEDIARISGHPDIPRKSVFHALNQRAIAHLFCKQEGLQYDQTSLIVVHMGGGISIGLHHKGKVVDANNALDGDGPMTPERSGGLPSGGLVDMCYSGKSKSEVYAMILGKGGMVAYFGTNDMQKLEARAQDEPHVKLHLQALAYQTAKEIAALSTVVCGKLDGILLTGGIAYSKLITQEISRRVEFISKVSVFAGEDELRALALGGLRVLTGKEKAKTY